MSKSMVLVRAPVRVSFGGGGTDLAAYYTRFGGRVLSGAITRYAYVAASRPRQGGIQINSADFHVWESVPPKELPRIEEPLALPKAAVSMFVDHGITDLGVDLFTASEVPPGTGLGSSSAVAVALLHALSHYLDLPLTRSTLAARACRLEIELLKMPIGKQDQYASAFGGINTISFTSGGVEVEPLDLPIPVRETLNDRLLLFSTGTSRHSSSILRQQQVDTRENQEVTDSLHHLKTFADDMRQALEGGRLDEFGELLDGTWQYKKHLSSKVSSAAIDRIYSTARDAGALGGKIAGAGGGGFLLLYCREERQEDVREAMLGEGLRELEFGLDLEGSQVISASERTADWRSAVGKVISPDVLTAKRQQRASGGGQDKDGPEEAGNA